MLGARRSVVAGTALPVPNVCPRKSRHGGREAGTEPRAPVILAIPTPYLDYAGW